MPHTFSFSRWIPVLVLVLLLTALSPPAMAEQRLTLSQAVNLALKQSPQLALEQAKVDEAEASRKSMRGLFGPKLMLEGSVLVWDSPLAFSFDMPAITNFNELVTKYGLNANEITAMSNNMDLLTGMFKLFDMGDIREQVTAQVSVTLAQPLTPLLQIYQGYKATRSLSDAAAVERKGKDVDVAHQVTKTYLQLMQVQRFVKVAATGVEQVAAHLKQARHFHEAGLIGKQMVLKAQLELARAKERVIKARYGAGMAASALAVLMGLPAEEVIVPTEEVTDPPAQLSQTLEGCIKRAHEGRSELKSLNLKHEAALAGKDSLFWGMILPQVSAIATYQYNYGQGTFSPENSFFGGGVFSWEVWDWGHKYYSLKAADAKARQASSGKRLLRDGIVLQVKKAYFDLKQAEEALSVARAVIVEAEENFRIEQKRFETQANTSTDVLDAQLALTRAQLSYTTSLYGHYIARAELKRAMGQM